MKIIRGMERNEHNFLSLWTIFFPLLPPTPKDPENKNFEKMKK